MIDTDKYEGTNWDLRGQFTHTEMADEVLLLLAEVKRLNAYIESIFDGGMLDIETYEEYKERIE